MPHGPLQLLMTVAEEVGLEGANGLDGSLVTARSSSTSTARRTEADRRVRGSTDSWVSVEQPREPVRRTVHASGER